MSVYSGLEVTHLPLSSNSIMDTREFEWESQLRFYWDQLPDELMVRQCTGEFGYGYEYMGLNGRLVITPLTDRIYLTITQVRSFVLLLIFVAVRCLATYLPKTAGSVHF